MIFLTADEIIVLHGKLLNKTGGLDGIRDLNLLESAVSNCLQTFDGKELYPAITDKAAYLAYSLCSNHPFLDGNKRISVLAMLMTLKLNGIEIRYTQNELIDLGLVIANGSMRYDEIKDWINQHKI